MDKRKFSNNLKKILGEKKLSNLISICLVLAFIFVTMNVLVPKNKYISKSNDLTYKEDKKESPKRK
nr:hypothetical protein [Clostridium botulinum]